VGIKQRDNRASGDAGDSTDGAKRIALVRDWMRKRAMDSAGKSCQNDTVIRGAG
jgi:hypothetical protein